MRELGVQKFSTEKHTSQNMLMNYGLADAAMLNRHLTKLWGVGLSSFPILSATQGMGSIKTQTLSPKGDSQYIWNVDGRPRYTTKLAKQYATQMGTGGVTFELEFKDNWLIYQHDAISPSGVRCRVQSEGVSTGNGYRYKLVVHGSSPSRHVPASDLKAGAVWALGISSIPSSLSDGNRANSQVPFKATNQYSYTRQSKGITGNMGATVVNIQLKDNEGNTYDQWMPYEMKQWELLRRQMIEEDLWSSQYNRDELGQVTLIDPYTNLPIPKGAGIEEQIASVGNLETYSELTLRQIDNLVDRIDSAQQEGIASELICYCGKGFNRMFNAAIENDIRARHFFTPMGDEVIQGGSELLTYGRYYARYKMLNGNTLVLKPVEIFDKGITATQQKEAVSTNPELMYDGLPLNSYTAAFIDHSRGTNGEANVQFVTEEGFMKTAIYEGMSNLPNSWASTGNRIASRKDEAYYEWKDSYGIQITNPTTSFMFKLSR